MTDRIDVAAMGALPTGTVTFLFTDVEGSTRLLQDHPRDYPVAIARHHEILAESVRRHAGEVFETVGDAVYAAFSRVEDAARAAVEGQRWLSAEDRPVRIKVRMGIHTGDVELRGEHYFGPALYRCARIMAVGHGGQILVSDVSVSILRDALPEGLVLRDLGEHRLKDLLRPERIHQLSADGLPSSFPSLRTLEKHRHNLPIFPTAFVGREAQTRAISGLLQAPETRLVTLTGPGGTGKTRSALQAAADVIDAFPDGVWFVPLADVLTGQQVPEAIAAMLGISDRGGREIASVVNDSLCERRMLLVLDNFEQLLEHATIVSDLLAGAAQVRVLVTSRAPLRIRGEREFPVPPLDLPELGRDPVGAVESGAATRLFLQRAREIRPDLALTPPAATAVAEICRRVDGLPLAIELAAARVRVLSPEALAARLERRLPLLTSGARDLPVRQRTLRDTIAWSHDLLRPRDRAIFRRAGVFAGGWELDAADSVLDLEGMGDVLDALESLVGNSLLRREEGLDADRFSMLETIREYALDRLDDSGERDETARRHAAHFADLAEGAMTGLRGHAQLTWVRRLDRASDNLKAAMAWALDRPEHTADAWRIGAGMAQYWEMRARLTEGRTWLERIAARPASVSDGVRAVALSYAAFFAAEHGDPAAAARHSSEAVDAARRSDDAATLAVALAGAFAAAPASDIAMEVGALARSTDDPWTAAWGFMIEGEWLRRQGEHDAAAENCARAVEAGRRAGDDWITGINLMNLGSHFLRRGDLARAHQHLSEALRRSVEHDDAWGVAYALGALGGLLEARDEHEEALTVLGAVDAWFRTTGLRMQDTDRADLDAAVARARASLTADIGERAWTKGATLTLDEAMRLATEDRGASQ